MDQGMDTINLCMVRTGKVSSRLQVWEVMASCTLKFEP